MAARYPKTALVCNRKTGEYADNASDREAEFDSPETIEAIRTVIESRGVDIVSLEADASLPERLKEEEVRFVFNLAEGTGGRDREAEVPALLELLGIPYTGSDATTMAVSLDKDMCKRLVSSFGVKTAGGAVLRPGERDVRKKTERLTYPLILKPNAEGSGRGIFENCIVKDVAELTARLDELERVMPCDMLAEEYLSGREFTVGLLGNGEELRVFPPVEIRYLRMTQDNFNVYSYKVKKDFQQFVEYRCPAELTKAAEDQMKHAAKTIFLALGCRDFARVDFRMNEKGEACFLELNPLPGLAPDYSDYPMTAAAEGISYEDLVFAMYQTAIDRVKQKGATPGL